MKKHPSGRPQRLERKVERLIWRIPDDGFVIPRLRNKINTQAIGFTHNYREADDEGGLRGMWRKDRR